MSRPMLWRYERMAGAMGYSVVAGVDEVGMGPLAGPGVGGAVLLAIGTRIPGLDDSKLLTAEERERLDRIIRRRALAVSVCAVDHAQVDRLGLIQARDCGGGGWPPGGGRVSARRRVGCARGAASADGRGEGRPDVRVDHGREHRRQGRP